MHSIREDSPFSPEQSRLVLDSPSEPDEDTIVLQPLKPAISEPQWQMVSPPASAAPSTTVSNASSSTPKKSAPSSASSAQTPATQPSVDIDEPDTALKTAVEVSIARQISISRQQRQLLRPLQTSLSQRGPRGASPGATGPKLGRNERLNETKYSTPTLVVPQETLDSQLAQHRRSERVVLEAA
ncbi:hypothetical protein NKR23_g8163 [Pleurostoma richardsiae]|uniref:Uncharacterized protein n=1 Tax=Pleurostoma richardsiae TaxID=41990 RepID=A0AA38VCY2_9PEZI|nr:hypothetical protein NKR23_g8163 [Pleurostoma richardsiae]